MGDGILRTGFNTWQFHVLRGFAGHTGILDLLSVFFGNNCCHFVAQRIELIFNDFKYAGGASLDAISASIAQISVNTYKKIPRAILVTVVSDRHFSHSLLSLTSFFSRFFDKSFRKESGSKTPCDLRIKFTWIHRFNIQFFL